MEIRIRATGAVMTEQEFRSHQKATDGPTWGQTTPEILNSLGADPVFEGPQATVTPPYEVSYRNGVEQQGGKWYTKYSVGPVFTDTTDDKGVVTTAAQHMAAYRAKKDSDQASAVRADRNKRVAEADWTQLPDAPLTAAQRLAWANYRQALRDITAQGGFPWTVTWPNKP
jgi:hypothetical protein